MLPDLQTGLEQVTYHQKKYRSCIELQMSWTTFSKPWSSEVLPAPLSMPPGLQEWERTWAPLLNYILASSAAAAKSLQSCQTLCDPIDGSPPGSPVPRILQARTLEWVAISFSNAWKWKVKVKSLSRVWLLATPWTAAYHGLLYPASKVLPSSDLNRLLM